MIIGSLIFTNVCLLVILVALGIDNYRLAKRNHQTVIDERKAIMDICERMRNERGDPENLYRQGYRGAALAIYYSVKDRGGFE